MPFSWWPIFFSYWTSSLRCFPFLCYLRCIFIESLASLGRESLMLWACEALRDFVCDFGASQINLTWHVFDLFVFSNCLWAQANPVKYCSTCWTLNCGLKTLHLWWWWNSLFHDERVEYSHSSFLYLFFSSHAHATSCLIGQWRTVLCSQCLWLYSQATRCECDCKTVVLACSFTLHRINKRRKKRGCTQTHTALICLLRYKYSATVRSLWLPRSCQRLLVRLSHQRSSSFLLPTDNTAIVAGLISLWWGLNGLYCVPLAIHSLVVHFSKASQEDEHTV